MKSVMMFALAMTLGIGGALAQGSGGGGAGGGGAGGAGGGTAGTGSATGSSGSGSGGTDTGSSGMNTGRNAAQMNPTSEECARGWRSGTAWTETQFRAACGNR
jgi:hypothetical protein